MLELLTATARAHIVAANLRAGRPAYRARGLGMLYRLPGVPGPPDPLLLFGQHLAHIRFVLERHWNDLVHDIALDIALQVFEHAKGIALIFGQRVALGDRLHADLLAQILHTG